MAMTKWNLIVDVEKCNNCNNCFLAVADEYQGNDHPGYAAPMPKHGHHWFDILRHERGQGLMTDIAHVPVMCQHCDDAPCIREAHNEAIAKRDDGIVIIDPEKARGQQHLVEVCPYGAIWWNEELGLPQHWIFDAHLLDRGWKEPRCVQSCPTGALKSLKVDDDKMAQVVEAEGLEAFNPELPTRPRVHYKNLYRYKTCFIGGSIAVVVDGVEDCLEGATVLLYHDGERVADAFTDTYGDFKFDKLEAGSGGYTVEVMHPDYQSKTVSAELGESITLGVIRLDGRG